MAVPAIASPRARVVSNLVLAVPVVVVLWAGWARRWMSDDGFINLRVVSEVTSGHGPVFNAGERVEAATSPLWVWLLTAGDVLTPVRLEWIAVLGGLVLTAAGVAMAILGARALLGEQAAGSLLLPAGALVAVALPPFWTFTTSGLEGGLTFAWLGGCCWVLGRWAARGGPLGRAGAVLLGVGPLVRPDAAVFSVFFLGVVLSQDRGTRVRTSVFALALPVAYQVFRMGYYGVPVPNPAITKSASDPYWSAGWTYLRESTGPYWLWVPVVVLLLGAYPPLVRHGSTRTRLVAAAFAGGAVVSTVYVVRVGGDFMHARLLLPSWFALTAPVAVVPATRRLAPLLLVVPWIVAGLFVVRPSADFFGSFGGGTGNPVTTADFGWDEGGGARAWFTGEGLYYGDIRLAAAPLPDLDPAVASYGVGIVAYALGPDTYVLDLLGLGDVVAAHLELPDRSYVGHEKPLPVPWIPARLTAPGTELGADDLPFPEGFTTRPLGAVDPGPFEERVEAARRALACGDLAELVASVDDPLTAGRFVDNLVGALGRWRVSVPPEPADAVTRFC